MGRWADLVEAMRKRPNSIRFAELVTVVEGMGYTLRRQQGSHRIYTAPNMPMINLQETKGQAKPYQVKQVVEIIDTHQFKEKE